MTIYDFFVWTDAGVHYHYLSEIESKRWTCRINSRQFWASQVVTLHWPVHRQVSHSSTHRRPFLWFINLVLTWSASHLLLLLSSFLLCLHCVRVNRALNISVWMKRKSNSKHSEKGKFPKTFDFIHAIRFFLKYILFAFLNWVKRCTNSNPTRYERRFYDADWISL